MCRKSHIKLVQYFTSRYRDVPQSLFDIMKTCKATDLVQRDALTGVIILISINKGLKTTVQIWSRYF